MPLERLVNSRAGLQVALGMARLVPPPLGRRLARAAARRLASRSRSLLVRSVRANQWVLSGGRLDGPSLDQAARDVLETAALSHYELFHWLRDLPALARRAEIGRRLRLLLEGTDPQGAVYVFPHFGAFDVLGCVVGHLGWRAQTLTVAEPPGHYRLQNAIRHAAGIEATPVSPESLRRALRRLRSGGGVMTAVDRRLPGAVPRPRFCGRPAELPVLHVRLALRAEAPLVLLTGVRRDDGTYFADASEPIPLPRGSDSEDALLAGAEIVLERVAGILRADPRQWGMTHAVWPEALEQAPA
jgi:lauroyl/myristoyl acyltransferase